MPEVGKVYSARVASIKPFGAFLAIDNNSHRQGLLHISQIINGRRLERVEEVLGPGDEVRVVVLGTDNNRLAFSMRTVDQATGEIIASDAPGVGAGAATATRVPVYSRPPF